MTNPVRNKEDFLVFGSPAIERPEIDEVIQTLESGWLGTGPKVAQFEQAVAEYKGVSHAVAVNSCTAALHLSLIAAGIGPGDEVITTPMTFCATVNAIIHCGATPVLADIDPQTLNLNSDDVRRHLTSRTKAILPVHFAGRACDMDALGALAKKHDLMIIEDCAHAIETEYKGRKAGTFGDFGCLSFYVTKNVVTGEGGMVLTDNDELADRIRMLSLHGMSRDAWKRFGSGGYKHYQVLEAGFKYNMMDLQAAIGIHQMQRVEQYWEIRRRHWKQYDDALVHSPLVLPEATEMPGGRHALHLYTVLVDEAECGVSRDVFIDEMTKHGIGVGVHYLSIPEHQFYQDKFAWRPEDYPNAMKAGRQIASLPLSAKMTKDDVADAIEAIHRIID